jgi:RNA polymerase sigma-70 factor (ECF subfamily)
MEISESGRQKKKEFERIYNHFFSFFFDVAFHFLHHEEDAKGLVQDAFIKLWENGIYSKPEQEIKNYLFILIRNSSLNILRKRQKFSGGTDSKEALLASINYKLLNETGEDILLYQELFEKIQLAISNLTPQCRQVFMFSRFEDLSNKEIAEKLDISVKAVEANITRALKRMREELSPYLSGKENRNNTKHIRSILISFL